MDIPLFYAVVDTGFLASRNLPLREFTAELAAAGGMLVQLRDKEGPPQEVLRAAALMRQAFAGTPCRLIMNDHADLAVLADFDGVHLGQDDLSSEDARLVVGAERWIGISTHTEAQVRTAEASCADYVAIGPVFATGTKLDAAAVVGLEGVRHARASTTKPLVAIGGITRANARSVIEAGADSVAVISGLLLPGESVSKVARDFLDILG